VKRHCMVVSAHYPGSRAAAANLLVPPSPISQLLAVM